MSKTRPLIMVIEDEPLLLEAIAKKLQVENIESLGFVNGKEAIESLRRQTELPDAIWLDYYLKDMNGLSFMHALKNNPAWAAIPVVVISNSASPANVNSMLALGIKKYLLKAEYRLEDIIETIKELIHQEEKE